MLNSAYIDLSAIISNARRVKEKLPHGVRLCSVVKAEAYGHGGVMTANALYGLSDAFAVAIVEEGVELRLGGIDKEILVLTKAFGSDMERAVRYGLTLTAAELADIKLASVEGARQRRTVKIHIKCNTGMNRQGADIEELKRMLDYAEHDGNVHICGVYSHYARPEDDGSRAEATAKFRECERLVKSFNNKAVAHISASGGFLKGEYFDMVRIGILLYGYKPFPSQDIVVKPAMSVYAPVLCRRRLKRGESALYGDFPAESDTDIAIVRYGYADGLLRKATKGLFNNRCMDVTAMTGVGDKELVPVMTNADMLAAEYGTINYEILTKVSARAEKIYIQE